MHYLTFDLDPGVKVTRNVTQYSLDHVIYAPSKFQVAMSNDLGEDTITRNVTDGRTDRQTDGRTDGRRTEFGTKLIYPIFFNEKAGIITESHNGSNNQQQVNSNRTDSSQSHWGLKYYTI